MRFYDDGFLSEVIIILAIGGLAGFFTLGLFGFYLRLVIPLVIGANMQGSETEKGERIAELEQQVEALKNETEEG
ncbi:hypothetical protein [Halarchaeum sp. P4]|uniref:hypothetical protein n=1 Tax=Halarchaeum sp. P4 TaxID=3421639 RepID=UPI003EBDFCE8